MIVNDKGQIVGDDGFLWVKSGGRWWSTHPGPRGYGIERARYYSSHFEQPEHLVRAQWELIHYNLPGSGFRTSTAHRYLYRGYSVRDCMRAAEIHWIRRIR